MSNIFEFLLRVFMLSYAAQEGKRREHKDSMRTKGREIDKTANFF